MPIVPVSIAGLNRWYPPGSLLPIGRPRGVKLVIHPPVDASTLSEDELANQVHAMVNAGLPDEQKADPAEPACVK